MSFIYPYNRTLTRVFYRTDLCFTGKETLTSVLQERKRPERGCKICYVWAWAGGWAALLPLNFHEALAWAVGWNQAKENMQCRQPGTGGQAEVGPG